MESKTDNGLLTDKMNSIWNNIIQIGTPEEETEEKSLNSTGIVLKDDKLASSISTTTTTSTPIGGTTTTSTTNSTTGTTTTTTTTATATGTVSTNNNNSISSLLSLQDEKKVKPERPSSGLFSTFSSSSSVSSNKPKDNLTRKPSNTSSSWISQSFSDKFIEKLLESALPTASVNLDVVSRRRNYQKSRPPLSVPLTAKHYRSFQTRCGIFFETYYFIISIISWENTYATLSILSIYSFLCLNPKLIILLPSLYISLVIMVPAYIVRHPGPKSSSPIDRYSVPADGLPLCDAQIPKPVPEFSKDFYMNIVDTQNSMGDFVEFFDNVANWLSSFAYFQDEQWSSFIYLSLLLSTIIIYFSIPYLLMYIPWRLLFVSIAWVGVGLNYFKDKNQDIEKDQVIQVMKEISHIEDPKVKEKLDNLKDTYNPKVKEKIDTLKDTYTINNLQTFVQSQFDYISPHQQKEVQIFEIQQFDKNDNCWNSSIYYGTPYAHMKLPSEPLPIVTPTALSEIRPPEDWTFLSDQWILDFNPHEWIKLFGLDNYVYIDSDEKWVYDGNNGVKMSTWRRRRWTRLCSRKPITK